MNSIDFREHDRRELVHEGKRVPADAALEERLKQPVFDLRLAQQIRERLRDKKEADAFADAERRMRSRS